jgi:hypothetical protein
MKLEYLAEGSRACPLVRLYEFNHEDVLKLMELVRSLLTGDRTSVVLENEPWIESVGGSKLTLLRGERNRGVCPAGPREFECILDSDGWSNVEGLLDPFCDSNTGGFQWLTHYGAVALLISQNGQW